jgi:4-hydroxybenzoyl-CoA thioesterase
MTPGKFETQVMVRLRDCDPAGIVFYPRYLEMFNNLVEDWFRDGLQLSFSDLIVSRNWGIPTVHLEVDFAKPSRMGETLHATLAVRRIGRSSVHIEIQLQGAEAAPRVGGKLVLVLTDLSQHRAIEIPGDLREKFARYLDVPHHD